MPADWPWFADMIMVIVSLSRYYCTESDSVYGWASFLWLYVGKYKQTKCNEMLHHAQDSQYLDMSLCKKILLWQDISVWFGFRESNACANTNAASIFTKHTLGFQCPMVTKKVQATSPLSDILVVLSCHFGLSWTTSSIQQEKYFAQQRCIHDGSHGTSGANCPPPIQHGMKISPPG
jgi:hypothetical protein